MPTERTLDQTGLAQKGGAVVSDVKITSGVVEQAAKLATAECDLYLACDALVGADAQYLAAADPDRTTAVVSTTEIPNGRMIIDPTVTFPEQNRIRSAIDAVSAHAVYLDARSLAEALFDDDQYANILQLGAAFQTGALPLTAAALERAITLNGTAVRRNLQAFRRGRQLVADPEAFKAASTPGPSAGLREVHPASARVRAMVGAEPGSELARLLDIRVPDLIEYQDARYARAYAEFVERVRRHGSASTEVTETVARNLYKLMAYKDEYEVARLSLEETLTQNIEARFGSGARYSYRLHPPVLRALGMERKISLGPWFRPVFRTLRAMRKLRGTRLDLFGYAEVRRVERELIQEYRETILRALSTVRPNDLDAVVELAELPDMVRGYEQIKLDNVDAYHRRRSELLEQLRPALVREGPTRR
ncbi:DUF6537 domain-containing protein [Streptomyces sp. NPDC059455]|uniref:DUF6537 domain-containing protein n=1 Tax=Streptomyces sp. NPDC059455 TaxID=3346837 RepID=UPI0036C7017A